MLIYSRLTYLHRYLKIIFLIENNCTQKYFSSPFGNINSPNEREKRFARAGKDYSAGFWILNWSRTGRYMLIPRIFMWDTGEPYWLPYHYTHIEPASGSVREKWENNEKIKRDSRKEREIYRFSTSSQIFRGGRLIHSTTSDVVLTWYSDKSCL